MEKKIGRIVKVFIPSDYKNGEIINNMGSNKVGFDVLIDSEILEIIQDQNEDNTNIYKDDLVIVTKQIISNKQFIDIEKYYGDDYE